MKDFDQAKQAYQETPIPAELNQRVEAGIRQGRVKHARRSWMRGLGTAAACFLVVVGALNLSPAVASAAGDMPVLGGLFQVLTVRRFEVSQDGINYQVNVPEVASGSTAAQRVNAVIQEKVDAHLAQAQRDWDEYREAFFATGGTEEAWGGREMDVFVDYDIKSQTDTSVSFTVTLAEGWVAAMEETTCYNLDLSEDRVITLADLLGENWTARCNEAVQAHIQASTDADGFSYFFSPEEGGFTTVDETTGFYIGQDGAPVLVFPKYSIAAGAAGTVEIPVR